MAKSSGRDLKCDVVIPMFYRDRYKVFNSLLSYRKEKNLVNTFIISYDKYEFNKNIIFEIIIIFFKKILNYNVVVLRNKNKIYASEARQRASLISKSEVIFYQDADDISHPNRISTIKEIFVDNPDCMHLLHSYKYEYEKFDALSKNIIQLKELHTLYSKSNSKPHRFGKEMGLRLALGVPVIRRKVINSVKWKNYSDRKLLKHLGERGEDHEFNMDCLFCFNQSYAHLSKPYRYMRENG